MTFGTTLVEYGGEALFLVIAYGYSVVRPSPHLGWRSGSKWSK
jgi:hypothetical protein